MTTRSSRALMVGLGLLAACTSPAPATVGQSSSMTVGLDLGASSRVPSFPVTRKVSAAPAQVRMEPENVQPVHDGHSDAHAVGVVNSVDPARHKINLTHQPIPDLGWPSMTMDFPVASSVNLSGLKPGAQVKFTIEKGEGGMYEVRSVQPAAANR